MDLLDKAILFEKDLFLWINSQHSPFWDMFMYGYTSKYIWIPLTFVLLYVVVYKIDKRESMLLILSMVLVGTLCDQISSELMKNGFESWRPTYHPDFKNLVQTVQGYRGGRFGFTSSHAANGIGIALFTSLVFRYRWHTVVSMLWVLVTCYSRVYLGVHFISDILGGLVVGICIALPMYWLYEKIRESWLGANRLAARSEVLSVARVKLLMKTIGLTVISLIIISWVIVFFFPDYIFSDIDSFMY